MLNQRKINYKRNSLVLLQSLPHQTNSNESVHKWLASNEEKYERKTVGNYPNALDEINDKWNYATDFPPLKSSSKLPTQQHHQHQQKLEKQKAHAPEAEKSFCNESNAKYTKIRRINVQRISSKQLKPWLY